MKITSNSAKTIFILNIICPINNIVLLKADVYMNSSEDDCSIKSKKKYKKAKQTNFNNNKNECKLCRSYFKYILYKLNVLR